MSVTFSRRCSARYTTSEFNCGMATRYIVGIPDTPDGWRSSCTQHLGKVVAERITAISSTDSVVVIDVSKEMSGPPRKDNEPCPTSTPS